jgi:hypothetical protein
LKPDELRRVYSAKGLPLQKVAAAGWEERRGREGEAKGDSGWKTGSLN